MEPAEINQILAKHKVLNRSVAGMQRGGNCLLAIAAGFVAPIWDSPDEGVEWITSNFESMQRVRKLFKSQLGAIAKGKQEPLPPKSEITSPTDDLTDWLIQWGLLDGSPDGMERCASCLIDCATGMLCTTPTSAQEAAATFIKYFEATQRLLKEKKS